MRIIDDSGTVTKCLLDPYDDEVNDLERAARTVDWEYEFAVQLMGRCGLRADEVTYPTRDRLRWSSSPNDWWFVEGCRKSTDGDAKKTRDVSVPDDVADNIQRFASERDRVGDGGRESWIDNRDYGDDYRATDD